MTHAATPLLHRLETYANEPPPVPYWIEGLETQAGLCYCEACVRPALLRFPEAWLGGGYAGEDDNCVHCTTCGCVLRYSLTDAGVDAELDHFASYTFRTAPSREEAYHIARILDAAPEHPDAIALADRAVAALPAFA